MSSSNPCTATTETAHFRWSCTATAGHDNGHTWGKRQPKPAPDRRDLPGSQTTEAQQVKR